MKAKQELLEISLKSINQLFNSMDPSPFYDRDLDTHAEQFLVSWAEELHSQSPLSLRLYLQEWPSGEHPEIWVTKGIHHYFSERERLTRMEFQRLLRIGRTNLLIGLAFLAGCLTLGQLVKGISGGVLTGLIRESLTIVGWVAMWRPLQIYLYDWWPLRQREALYRRLSEMPVTLQPIVTGAH